MRALLTGCGFIGSHTIRLAIESKEIERVVNLDSLTYSGQPMNLQDVADSEKYKFVHGSINDVDLVSSLCDDENIDVIIRLLVAGSHVDRSIDSTEDFVKTNIDGTRILLEQILRSEKKGSKFTFVHISTGRTYGSLSSEDPPFTENSPIRPMNPYSATKAASDMIVQSFVNTAIFLQSSRGVPTTTAQINSQRN